MSLGDDIRKDDDGNVIGCPHCGARSVHKSGFVYRANSKKQQWLCTACGRKTVKPTIIEKSPFKVEDIDPDHIPIEELITHRKKQYKQKKIAKESKKLIRIDINVDGPIGIAHFGDPHVDDDGTDLSQILHFMNVLNNTDGMFAGNLGDIQNNWIGRLSYLYGQQSTSAKESWRLTEYFVNKMNWLYLVAGNHDVWSGDGDPLDFIMRDHKGLYEKWGARMRLVFPNGKEITINARHTFAGHSMWNTAHGLSKAIQMGWRDHVLTAGHTHVSGYQVLKDPSTGLISHALRIASYKELDRYAEEKGLPDQNVFKCPVTIIDPQYADDDSRLITTIFDPNEGVDYLTWKRSKK